MRQETVRLRPIIIPPHLNGLRGYTNHNRRTSQNNFVCLAATPSVRVAGNQVTDGRCANTRSGTREAGFRRNIAERQLKRSTRRRAPTPGRAIERTNVPRRLPVDLSPARDEAAAAKTPQPPRCGVVRSLGRRRCREAGVRPSVGPRE